MFYNKPQKKYTFTYRWIQNYCAGSCLSFWYKGKGTTATSKVKVNMKKIRSQAKLQHLPKFTCN